MTGQFKGLPDHWKKLLEGSKISKDEMERDPGAVLDVLRFYEDNMKQGMKPVGIKQVAGSASQGNSVSARPPQNRPPMEPAPSGKPSNIRQSFSNSLMDVSAAPASNALGENITIMKSPSQPDFERIPPASSLRKMDIAGSGGSRTPEAPRSQPGGPPSVARRIEPPSRPAIVPRPPETIGSKSSSPVRF
jgi:serine/threonine-protein kinase CLA4